MWSTIITFGLRRKVARVRPSLLRSETANAALEFALVAPIFIGLIVAILQTSLVFFTQQVLETAAQAAARMIVTGQAKNNNMAQADLKTYACSKLPSYVNCASVFLDARMVSAFAGMDTSAPGVTRDTNGKPTIGTQYTQGSSNQIIILRLMYVYGVQGGPLGFDLSNIGNGQRLLVSTVVAKSEPY